MTPARARTLAQQLLDRHGLSRKGWTFAFNRRKTACGLCRYRDKRIELSAHHVALNDEDAVMDTLLHEVAHAIAGPRAKHGPKWKLVARQLGATPRASAPRGSVAAPPGRYRAVCPTCDRAFHRHRKPRPVPCWCGRCGPHLGALEFIDTKPAAAVVA